MLFPLFFQIISLYFLIPAETIQIFNPTAEVTVPTGAAINEAKAEVETQLLTAETKTKKCSK